MDVHPAVLAGAHQRVSALSLLRDAFPFRGHAVPIAVVAAAVASFMAPAHFDPRTFPQRISVLNVQVKTRPAAFFQDYVTSNGSRDFPGAAVPSHEANRIAETLCRWRPLKALTLGTGGRVTEVLNVGPILTLRKKSKHGQVDLTMLTSLSIANCIIIPGDIPIIAARATALTSLQLSMPRMKPAAREAIVAAIFSEQWQGKLRTLMVEPPEFRLLWDRAVGAAERAAASGHPCAVTSTLQSLLLYDVLSFSQFRRLVAACRNLRRLEIRSVNTGTPESIMEAACCGSVALSSLQECRAVPGLQRVPQARRELKRILRSDSSRAATAPTLVDLGLADACFSSLTVMPRDCNADS